MIEETRCRRVGAWFEWDRPGLYLKGECRRQVPPICTRAKLVATCAAALGYPGGDRLYQALKQRYYWAHMHRDCTQVCSTLPPFQVEQSRFRAPPTIKSTWKGRRPFALWCLDLVTKLEPPGALGETICITAVCPFSKWVEAAPLRDRQSFTVMKWFEMEIVTRYGVPWGIRVDQGTEFKGAFKEYCEHLSIVMLPIFTSHPQANGLIERYNGVIRAGLRMTS